MLERAAVELAQNCNDLRAHLIARVTSIWMRVWPSTLFAWRTAAYSRRPG